MLFKTAWQSLRYRWASALLTLIALSVSCVIVLSVQHVRQEIRNSFNNSVSGVDLIVGARTSPLNLLLYSVFRIGTPSNNIRWSTIEQLQQRADIQWLIPLSLGDSHRGYRVLGTTHAYFEHFRYGQRQSLRFRDGDGWKNTLDVVLGYHVAAALNYQVGDQITLSHGLGSTSFSRHDDQPFTIVGILEPTGTPVDQTLHVSLAAIEAIHVGWQDGARLQRAPLAGNDMPSDWLQPTSVTAALIGLNSRLQTFPLQRFINQYPAEPLMAIMPGVALSELWQLTRWMEQALAALAVLVVVAALIGLAAMLLAAIHTRQREIQILRTLGARPWFVVRLICTEAMLLAVGACWLAIAVASAALYVLSPWLLQHVGLAITATFAPALLWQVLGVTLLAALVVSLIPAAFAYRLSLTR